MDYLGKVCNSITEPIYPINITINITIMPSLSSWVTLMQKWGPTGWHTVRAIERFGNGTLNEAGEQLLQFTNVNDLLLTNTCFKQAKANREWTWKSPHCRTHNTIDYILIKKKWRDSATNCRALPSADIGSDHQLLILNLRLKLNVGRKSKSIQKFDIG